MAKVEKSPDLFYAPTRDELESDTSTSPDMFSAPQEPPSMAKSALLGAANSATFGFAPKITGAGQAGLDILQDPDKLQQFMELYKQHAGENQQAYKTAEETNPASYTAGEIGGAFLAPIPGAGLAKEASIGAKILSAAKTGAKVGGLTALGQSDVNANLPETAKEVAKGAAGGGVIGGALSGVTEGVTKGAKAFADRSSFIQDLLESYKRGKAGEELAGTIGKKQTEESINQTAEEIRKLIQGEIGRGSNIKKEAEKLAEEQGLNVNISGILKKYEDLAANAPERLPRQKKEKEELLSIIKNELYGPEVEKSVVTPGTTEVIPGKTLMSGEEEAIDALRTKQAAMGVKQELGEPQAVAEAKLKEKFAGGELTSEQPSTVPFRTPETAKSTSGLEALRTTGPEGELLAQVVKNISPGEIKVVTDPTTGKKVAAFMDEASGKVYTQPVSDQAAQTLVKFKETPEVVQKIMERSGGKTELGATELKSLIKDISETSKLGEESFKTQEISGLATGLTKELKGAQRGEAFGPLGEQSARGDEIMSAGLKARDLLFPALSGLTDQEKVRMENKLSGTIKKLGQDTETAASARFIVDEALEDLKKTNPDLVKQISDKMKDRATAYDLTKKIGAESAIQGRFLATAKGAALGTSNIVGNVVGKVGSTKIAQKSGEMASTMKSFISGSTPETLKSVRESLSSTGKAPADLISKLQAAEEAETPYVRNALLYSIMQQPSYREMLGISNEQR